MSFTGHTCGAAAVAVVILLAGCANPAGGGGAGGGGGTDPYIDWAPYYDDDVAVTSSDWGAPELVAASTPGWEEGVYISGDGDTLYYIYTHVDVFRDVFTGETNVSGPLLDTHGQATVWADGSSRNAGEYPYADHFYVTRTGVNEWSAPQPHFLTTTRMASIGGLHIIESGAKRLAYCMSGFGDAVDSIFYAYDDGSGWQAFEVDTGTFTFDAYLFEVNLDPNGDSGNPNPDGHEDADPWVNDSGTIMFFWSDRNEGTTGKDIFYSTNANGIGSTSWASPAWTAPTALPAPVNTDGDDMQTFVFNEGGTDYLYYATNRGHDESGMSYEIAIYRVAMPAGWESTPSALGVSGNWGTPERVIHSDLAVGEPSITDDGQYLYFEQIFTDGNDNYNPEILRVKRN